jgi:hypothetical protein
MSVLPNGRRATAAVRHCLVRTAGVGSRFGTVLSARLASAAASAPSCPHHRRRQPLRHRPAHTTGAGSRFGTVLPTPPAPAAASAPSPARTSAVGSRFGTVPAHTTAVGSRFGTVPAHTTAAGTRSGTVPSPPPAPAADPARSLPHHRHRQPIQHRPTPTTGTGSHLGTVAPTPAAATASTPSRPHQRLQPLRNRPAHTASGCNRFGIRPTLSNASGGTRLSAAPPGRRLAVSVISPSPSATGDSKSLLDHAALLSSGSTHFGAACPSWVAGVSGFRIALPVRL